MRCLKIYGQPLAPQSCTLYTTPASCAYANNNANSCGWCASSQSCNEVTLDFNAYCNSDCAPTCLKIFGNPLSPPLCSAYVDPGSCVYANNNGNACGWCGTINQCFELNVPLTDTCPTSECPNASTCLKRTGNPTPPGGIFCTNYSTPGTCVYANNNAFACGWCASSQLCFELQLDVKDTCGSSHGKCEYNCLKTSGVATTGVCSLYSTCSTCIYGNNNVNACGWCLDSNSCVELGRDSTPCQGSCASAIHGGGACPMS